jgi:hypothetical protein
VTAGRPVGLSDDFIEAHVLVKRADAAELGTLAGGRVALHAGRLTVLGGMCADAFRGIENI